MSDSHSPLLHGAITEKIIKGYYVYNELGPGFDERVYENALANWLRKQGFKVEQQKQIVVYFEGQIVGDYRSDIVVNDVVIVETKVLRTIAPENEAQLVNYLKATDLEVGLLLNFGPDPEFRRRVLTNEKKKHRPRF